MAIPVVPEETPDQSQIVEIPASNPYSQSWWTTDAISQIPEYAVGWLCAQGWDVTSISYDTTTVPPTPYYSLSHEGMQSWVILNDLLNAWVVAYNDAHAYNQVRYNEIVVDWTETIASSQVHFTAQTAEQNEYAADYGDELSLLESDYSLHLPKSEAYLDGLGATELARINEEFDSTLSTQLQQLTNRGLYSSAVAADITARNARDRDEQIQALNDRLNRERVDNEHKLYEQQVSTRTRVLAGKDRIHDENQRIMAYQLDARNSLIIGLYGFVERRDDVAPSINDLAQICTSFADSGGGWLTP